MSDLKLSNINGQLCICMIDDPYSKPEYTKSHFPTGAETKKFIERYGGIENWEVHPYTGDSYCICQKDRHSGPRYPITLKHGGKTKSIKFERIPIPPPKVKGGIEVRWNSFHHRWEKLLKTGWKTIY